MLEISNVPHRDVVQRVRNIVFQAKNTAFYGQKDRAKDLTTIDTAHEAHIKAKVAYSTLQSDFTMINLNGTWARLNRVMMEIEEKYGVRR